VADTTTLIAAPLAAACGVPVAKMSGRGLGHTGGTLDKLLSIPGMRVEFTIEEMIGLVRRVGLAVVGQSDELDPADRKLYALRDATATVDHAALIASSVMSKKIAAGCQGLVLDVKAGSGAFNGTVEEARRLARIMTALGRRAGLRAVALVTDMNQPLGRRIGNGLEVREALEVLSGGLRQGRLRRVALALAAEMLALGGAAADPAAAEKMLIRALDDGRGMEKLLSMGAAQGGDAAALSRPETLWPVRTQTEIPAPRSGFVARMDARAIGRAACLLGAGRRRKEDAVDPAAGITMLCELGGRVSAGQSLAVFHVNDGENLEEARRIFTDAVVIEDGPPELSPVILDRIAP
jgi:pyrimidine-nucleoside phosphorylase/thymidine phosphorylase